MFRKAFFLMALLGAAVAVPFSMTDGNLASKVKTKLSHLFRKKGDSTAAFEAKLAEADASAADPVPGGPLPTLHAGALKNYDRGVEDLREVIRFDIDASWIMSRWSRVSTTLAESELEGLRVALVTGTEIDDITGSLTYYFNKKQQVQRITLHGQTGDPKKLEALVSQHFGFRRQPTLGASLFLNRWNGKSTGLLRISHASVVRADTPHSRMKVVLEINRPGAYYGLSDESKKLLEGDQQARRW